MALSPTEARTALKMLTDIRQTQNKTIRRMTDDWRNLMRLETGIDEVTNAIVELGSTVAPEPTSQQTIGFRRDVMEFRQDVSALRVYVNKLANMTRDVMSQMGDIKTTLDAVQSHLEESEFQESE